LGPRRSFARLRTGYTLMLIGTAAAINTTLYENKISYNFLRDLAPVASIICVPNVVAAHQSVPE
jgi:tripartite-type tricarboxylate transporter receptor subunit TctC